MIQNSILCGWTGQVCSSGTQRKHRSVNSSRRNGLIWSVTVCLSSDYNVFRLRLNTVSIRCVLIQRSMVVWSYSHSAWVAAAAANCHSSDAKLYTACICQSLLKFLKYNIDVPVLVWFPERFVVVIPYFENFWLAKCWETMQIEYKYLKMQSSLSTPLEMMSYHTLDRHIDITIHITLSMIRIL